MKKNINTVIANVVKQSKILLLLCVILSVAEGLAQDSTKVTDMPAVTAPDGTEVFYVAENDSDKQMTWATMASAVQDTIANTTGDVTFSGSPLVSAIGTGKVTTVMLLDETITAADIDTNAVTTSEILNNAVTSAKILNNTIIALDIATSGVETTEILDSTILGIDIALQEVALNHLTIAAINYINAAGGGTITNQPDDNSIENVTDTTLGVKQSWLDAQKTYLYGSGTTTQVVTVNSDGDMTLTPIVNETDTIRVTQLVLNPIDTTNSAGDLQISNFGDPSGLAGAHVNSLIGKFAYALQLSSNLYWKQSTETWAPIDTTLHSGMVEIGQAGITLHSVHKNAASLWTGEGIHETFQVRPATVKGSDTYLQGRMFTYFADQTNVDMFKVSENADTETGDPVTFDGGDDVSIAFGVAYDATGNPNIYSNDTSDTRLWTITGTSIGARLILNDESANNIVVLGADADSRNYIKSRLGLGYSVPEAMLDISQSFLNDDTGQPVIYMRDKEDSVKVLFYFDADGDIYQEMRDKNHTSTVKIQTNGDSYINGGNLKLGGIPADSSGLATGQLWFNNSTGAIMRKF